MKLIDGRPRSQAGRRLYWVWAAMIQRCHNPRNKCYPRYGAKGITVCPEWHSFDAFFRDMGLPADGMTLERKDSFGGYGPANCKWAARLEQSRNRPTWCLKTDDGESLLDVWQRRAHSSVSYRSFRKRLRLRGWSLEDALSCPERGSPDFYGYRSGAAERGVVDGESRSDDGLTRR